MAVDDQYTIVLLHFNGADGSTTITNEAPGTFTAFGNAQIDTAQSKFGGASCLFDGAGDYVSAGINSAWRLDDGSNSNLWTIDFWVRFNGDPGTGVQGFLQRRLDNDNFWTLDISNNTLRFIVRTGGANDVVVNPSWNPAAATWYHIAVVKDGTNGYMVFVDGTQIGSTVVDTSTMPSLSAGLTIGRYIDSAGASNYLDGWMDELRISKGAARWTADFTPPTAEYTPPANFFPFFD